MVLGNYVLSNAQEVFSERKEKPHWDKALNLVPYVIIPHFDWVQKNKSELFNKLMRSAPKIICKNWLGIDEDTALIIAENKHVRIIGKGKLTFKKGNKFIKYNFGQAFTI